MKTTWMFRAAAILQSFMAVTHTIGLLADESRGLVLDAALKVIKSQTTVVMGSERTIWEFYIGFGLLFTVAMLVAAAISWLLGSAVGTGGDVRLVRSLAWVSFLGQLAVTALCFRYFFIAPQVVSLAAAICLGVGAMRVGKTSTEPSGAAAPSP